MNFSKYENRGLSGLLNLGNTCFINSCIQILSHTYELNSFLESDIFMKKIQHKNDSILLLEWNNLKNLLWSSNCIISPGKFISTIQKIAEIKKIGIFTGYSQNDLPEFLLFIIDCFHNALSREINMSISGNCENKTDEVAVKCFEMIKNMYSKEYSEIWNMFYAIHVSEITSLENGEILQQTPEPYFIINLPVPHNNKLPSLIDCFDLYIEGEILEGDNAWFNEKTGKKENISKKLQFWSFPTILVIDFKRFNSNGQKNQKLITFSLDELDLSKYVIGYKKNSYKYELYGVCNHSGGVLGGHYTAYIKNANNKWYHFDDATVTEVEKIEYIVSPKAYCLFFRKKQTS
jgi:ubiquitin carboxyl-terminal hydrolase 8